MVDIKDTYILFQDNYPTIYKRLGISRDEMMILMPQVMRVDVLAGLDNLSYIGEEKMSSTPSRSTSSEKWLMSVVVIGDVGDVQK